MPHQRTPADCAIEALTLAFENTMNANICATSMRSAADCIEIAAFSRARDRGALLKFFRSCSGLLRAGVKFATRKMTDAEHRALVKHLCSCRCDMKQNGMAEAHIPEKPTYRPQGSSTNCSSVSTIMESLAALGRLMCMAMKMAHLTRNKFFGDDNRNKAGQLMWPQGPQDLLPHGLGDSVAGLDLWFREDGGQLVIPLFVALVRFYQPFAASLVDPPAFTVALVRPLRHLTKVIENHEQHIPLTMEDAASEYGDFNYSVRTILLFFEASLDQIAQLGSAC